MDVWHEVRSAVLHVRPTMVASSVLYYNTACTVTLPMYDLFHHSHNLFWLSCNFETRVSESRSSTIHLGDGLTVLIDMLSCNTTRYIDPRRSTVKFDKTPTMTSMERVFTLDTRDCAGNRIFDESATVRTLHCRQDSFLAVVLIGAVCMRCSVHACCSRMLVCCGACDVHAYFL